MCIRDSLNNYLQKFTNKIPKLNKRKGKNALTSDYQFPAHKTIQNIKTKILCSPQSKRASVTKPFHEHRRDTTDDKTTATNKMTRYSGKCDEVYLDITVRDETGEVGKIRVR